MNKSKAQAGLPAFIIYGYDHEKRPRAGCFDADAAALVEKIADAIKFTLVKIATADQLAIAKELPPGRVSAPGFDALAVAPKALFEKLLACCISQDNKPRLTGPAPKAAENDPSPLDQPPTGGGLSKPPESMVTAAEAAVDDKSRPSQATEIKVGDVVLAENSEPSTGWFEAVVLEQIGADQLRLRWRDYPEDGTLVRRRQQLALLPAQSA